MGSPLLSIVIPTFNRCNMLSAAIESARQWLSVLGTGEIVVVDDASTDDTAAMIHERYAADLERELLIFHRRPKNGGAAAAKNSGARLAKGEWIVFLDSDDQLVADAVVPVMEELRLAATAPAVFFRCIEKSSGKLVGEPLSSTRSVDLRQTISQWRWAECLPIVRAGAARRFPYDEDLPGCEGISYARMAREIGSLVVTPVIARIYDTGDHDRVTTVRRLARSGRQKKYTSLVLREFWDALSPRTKLAYLASNFRARVENRIETLMPQRS